MNKLPVLVKSMDDFKFTFKKENQKSTEDLKKSIKDIAGVVPRVTALETAVKKVEKDITKLDKDISNTKSGLKVRVTSVENEVKNLKSYDKSVKKLQDGIRGLEPRLQTVEKFVKSSKESLPKGRSGAAPLAAVVAGEVSELQSELSQLGTSCSMKFDIVTGWMEKMNWQQQSLQSQIEFNMSKNMQCELRMGGIAESPRENCKLKVLDFLKSKVKVTLQNAEVLWAFRSGKKATNVTSPRPHQMIARVTLNLKEHIMKNAKNLKGQSDPDSQVKCFVSVNEPEAYKAAHKKYKDMMDSICVANSLGLLGR